MLLSPVLEQAAPVPAMLTSWTPHATPVSPSGTIPESSTTISKISKKRPLTEDPDSDEPEDADAKRHRSEAAKGPRNGRTTLDERRGALEVDEWVAVVEPHQVKCHGCAKWIKLHKERQYDHTNWKQHRAKCPRINGITYKRKAIVPTRASKMSQLKEPEQVS